MRFDFETSPFPFATSNRLPSGVTRTEVGYHPTGMNPSERLLPGCAMSNTAMALMFAFATKRVLSSGESARLFGVAPRGELGFVEDGDRGFAVVEDGAERSERKGADARLERELRFIGRAPFVGDKRVAETLGLGAQVIAQDG